jgi:hypothetical protein
MSRVEVDKIQQQCGTTLTVGGGACKTAVVDATTVTLGRCGGTVSLASGATQSGFGRTGTVDWITTPKVTGDSPVTGVSGKGYFMNTTAGAITLNLPAGSAGDIISLSDYAATWQTYAVTVNPNGTEKIGGVAAGVMLSTEGQSVTLVYVDSTQGWINTMDSTSNVRGNEYIQASVSGACNTLTTCGNCKIAKFVNPGTFSVTSVHPCTANNAVSYVVVGGGGGGGDTTAPAPGGGGGGGGAGGYRETKQPITPYTASPLDGYPTPANRITVTATPYPITVGAGGNGASPSGDGIASTFDSITSAGGGAGGETGSSPPTDTNGQPGGSGGGSPADNGQTFGNGNTPPTTPEQGKDGGTGATGGFAGGGGGGASAAGGNGAPGTPGGGAGSGGNGVTSCITGSPTAYAGGGGAGVWGTGGGANPGCGGTGGGGKGAGTSNATAGTDNQGGGGGGGSSSVGPNPGVDARCASNGGSGIVIIRYKYQ